MKKTLEILDRLKSEELLSDFVVGGAIAAFRYIEPSLTDDLDIFIHMPSKGLIVDLSPIYSKLKEWGYDTFKHEGIVIEGWPVQFLPADKPLEDEAMASATTARIEGTHVKVFTAEYVMALALGLGRAKDRTRLAQFIEEKAYNEKRLEKILAKHDLLAKWTHFINLAQQDDLSEGIKR